MPDLSDLHDAFARLEQQVPANYRSTIVADRVSDVLGQSDRPVRNSRPWIVGGTALLAAAAVVVIAVAASTFSHHGTTHAPVGDQPTVGLSALPAPSTSPTTTAPPSPPGAGGAFPATPTALLAYVRGARWVNVSDYEQAEPGPGQAMQPTPGIAEFITPSGNITCAIVGGTGSGAASVTCQAVQSSFPIPTKPESCRMNWARYFGFALGGQVSVGACVGGPEFGPTTMALPYGSAIQLNGIGCRSESGFLACADLATGHGFAVDRDTLRVY